MRAYLKDIEWEVYSAWCGRLGPVHQIPRDSVQALFNDMQLYPSKAQVAEMLQCARQCSQRNSSQFLTFGEFCVFVGELRKGCRQDRQQRRCLSRRSSRATNYEVFLGGSCNPTTWRTDIAIPTLTKLGITYYNPQVATWSPELMATEHDAKQSASVLLFVVDSQTRCVAGMVEVAQLVAARRCIVLVAHPYSAGQSIMGESVSFQEYLDLAEAKSTLLALVRSQGVTVFSNLTSALQCTSHLLRDSSSDSALENRLTEKLLKLREVFDAADINRTGELTLSEACNAYYQLTNHTLRIPNLRMIVDNSAERNPNDVRISFEQFCGIVAEFGMNGGSNSSTKVDDWINQPLQRQCSTNNNTHCDSVDSHTNCTLTNGDSSPVNGSSHFETDVYLGGTYTQTTLWRHNIAIPLLKKNGLSYSTPMQYEKNCNLQDVIQMNDSRYGSNDFTNQNIETTMRNAKNILESDDLLRDLKTMETSRVLLFVITNESRSITSMILAAHFIGLGRDVVLCVQQLPTENCFLGCEELSKQAIKDYNRGRAYLSDLAKREQVPVFESITDSIHCAIDMCKKNR